MRPAALVLIVALLSPVILAAPAPEVGKLPEAVLGASSARGIDGNVYVFGGRHANNTYSDAIVRHDPATNAAIVVGRLPLATGMTTGARYSGSALAVGTKLYYFGGAAQQVMDLNGDGQPERVPRALPDIVEYDPLTGQARTLADALPQGAWGMTAVASQDQGYLLGGFSFDVSNLAATHRHDRVIHFDPLALPGSRVTELSVKLPLKVQDAAGALVGGAVYIAGGLADHDFVDSPCPTFRSTDPTTGQDVEHQISVCLSRAIMRWDLGGDARVVSELPRPLQFSAAISTGEDALLSGGLQRDGMVTDEILRLDFARPNPVHSAAASLPSARMAAASSAVGSSVFVYGGRADDPSSAMASIVAIDATVQSLPAPPGPPLGLSTELDAAGVRLTWSTPAIDPSDEAASSYRVYRRTAQTGETLAADTSALSILDRDAPPGAQVRYRVVATNSVGEGPSAVSLISIPTPPSTPRNVRADSRGINLPPTTSTVQVSWQIVPGADTYAVLRNIEDGPEEIVSSRVVGNNYIDPDAPTLARAEYRVVAQNGWGTSAPSEPASVTTSDHVVATVPNAP